MATPRSGEQPDGAFVFLPVHAQPWVKGYVYNAEFEVHYHKVWLDK